MERHLYSVKYRHLDDPKGRIHRLTVVAKDADEAREYARIRDVRFGSTIDSPKRRGVPVCSICHGPLDDDYTRLTEGGFACWRCREKADLPEDQEFVTVDGGRHGDIAVEWT